MSTATVESAKAIGDQMVDVYLASFGPAFWAQEQAEKCVTALVEQERINRAEAQKLLEKFGGHVRENQAELQRFISSVVKLSTAVMKVPTYAEMDELKAKVEALTREVESLRKK